MWTSLFLCFVLYCNPSVANDIHCPKIMLVIVFIAGGSVGSSHTMGAAFDVLERKKSVIVLGPEAKQRQV